MGLPHCGKVMRLDRPKAKIRFKLDSNRLLSPDLIKIVGTIQIRTQISNPNSIYIKNWSNLIENCHKSEQILSLLSSFLIKINLFNILIDFFNLLIKLFNLYIDLLIEID